MPCYSIWYFSLYFVFSGKQKAPAFYSQMPKRKMCKISSWYDIICFDRHMTCPEWKGWCYMNLIFYVVINDVTIEFQIALMITVYFMLYFKINKCKKRTDDETPDRRCKHKKKSSKRRKPTKDKHK